MNSKNNLNRPNIISKSLKYEPSYLLLKIETALKQVYHLNRFIIGFDMVEPDQKLPTKSGSDCYLGFHHLIQ